MIFVISRLLVSPRHSLSPLWCRGCEQGWWIGLAALFSVAAVGVVVFTYTLPDSSTPATFMCPLVPLFPYAGIAINNAMMAGTVTHVQCAV